MSDKWQPIETAPSDVRVHLGRYELRGAGPVWVEGIGVAWKMERAFYGAMRRVITYDGENSSHWKPLPPPPVTP